MAEGSRCPPRRVGGEVKRAPTMNVWYLPFFNVVVVTGVTKLLLTPTIAGTTEHHVLTDTATGQRGVVIAD